MRRIIGDTVDADKYGAGQHGFQEGNPEAMQPATIVSAAWLNQVQEELVRAIEWSGRTPADDPGQLAAALADLKELIDGAGGDPLALLSRANTWLQPQTFSQPVKLAAGYIANSLGIQGEPLYCSADGIPETRDRTVILPASAFLAPNGPDGTPQWFYTEETGGGVVADAVPGWVSKLNTTTALKATFHVPTGAALKQVRAGIYMQGSCTVHLSTGYERPVESGAGYALESGYQSSSRTSSGVLTHEVTAGGGLTPHMATPHDQAQRLRTLRLLMSDVVNPGYVALKWVKLVFSDPGPRNF